MSFRLFFKIAIVLFFALVESKGKSAIERQAIEEDPETEATTIVIQAYEKDRESWKDRELLTFALAYNTIGKTETAIFLTSKYLNAVPSSIMGLRAYGMMLAKQGRYEEALTSLKRALKEGEDLYALRAIAYIYLDLRNYDQFNELVPALLICKQNIECDSLKYLLTFVDNDPDTRRAKRLLPQVISGFSNESLAYRKDISDVCIRAMKRFDMDKRALAIDKLVKKAEKAK